MHVRARMGGVRRVCVGHAVRARVRAQFQSDWAEYELLLEEQADPFEVKAIQAHEANLGRMRQGVWNDWIRRSASALMELAPGRYGKNDQRDALYDSLL